MTVGIEPSKPPSTTRPVGDDTAELEEELAKATTPIQRRRLQNRIAQRNHRKRVRLAQQQQREQEEEEQRLQQQEQQDRQSPEPQVPDLNEEACSNSAGENLDSGMATISSANHMRHTDPHASDARPHPGSPAVSRMSIDNFATSRADFDFSMPSSSVKPPTPVSIDNTSNKSYRNSVSGCSFCVSCGAVNDVLDAPSLLETGRRIQDWRPVSPIDFDDPVIGDAHSFITLSQTQINLDQHPPPPQQQHHHHQHNNNQQQMCHSHRHPHNGNHTNSNNQASNHHHPTTPRATSRPAPTRHNSSGHGHHAHTPCPGTAMPTNALIVQSKAGTAQKWTTALHIAAERGHSSSVRLLLDRGGADVNEKDSRGSTALHVAAANGDEVMVRLLLECNADVHAADEAGWSALHRAAERGDEGVLMLLLGGQGGEGGAGAGAGGF